MSRLTRFQRLLLNLEQKLPKGRWGYMPREEAYKELKNRTGKDFGYDVEAWKQTENIMLNQKQISHPVFVEKVLKPFGSP